MKNKKLIAAFVFPERVEWFLSFLKEKYKINKDKVFCFKVLNDETKYLLTFKLDLGKNNVNFKTNFPPSLIIHKNGTTFYSINALNILIDDLIGESEIDKKTVKIDWSKYGNKFILTRNNDLLILEIERIF